MRLLEKTIFVLLFSISSIASYGQQKDFCQPQLGKDVSQKDFINDIINQFYSEVRSGGKTAEELLPCLDLAINLCKEEGLGITLVKAYDILGQFYLIKGQFETAKSYVLKGLIVSDSIRNIKCQARILNSLGNIESERGNVEKAINYYLQSKEAWKKKNARSKVLGLDINIATLYLDQGNYEEAQLLLRNCLHEAKDLDKPYLVNLSLINLGIIQEKIGNYRESLKFFQTIINKPHESIPQPILHKAFVFASKLSLRLNELKNAEYYFNEALVVNNDKEKLDLYISWGDGLSALGRHSSAIEKYLLAVDVSKVINDDYLLSTVYKKLSGEYRNINDFKNGWRFYEYFQEMDDTLRSAEKKIALNRIISKYKQREKELQIESLEKQRKSDSIIMLITFALLIVLIVALINIYSRYQYKQTTSEKLKDQNDQLIFQNNQIRTREKLLKKKNIEIEEKNGLLALHSNKIDQQNRELQRYNLDLEQFAYSVSHDLKAPIRSINSFLFLIQKNIKDQKIVGEYLSIAQDNSQLLANLLDDLLTYTRIGRSELRPSLVDLNEILSKVVKNLHYQVEKSKADITYQRLPVVNGFSADLYLLFQNLIQNSIKFRKPNVPLKIEILSQTLGTHYLISVKDNGIGIKNEYQDKIFKIFKRINNDSEGTGVGLAIVRKIIEYHNGDVTVESQEGIGTAFHIKLNKSL